MNITNNNDNNNVNLNNFYTGKGSVKKTNPKKRKKKNAFKNWWKKRKTWEKGLFITGISVLSLIIIAIICFSVYFFAVLNNIERDKHFENMENSELGFENVIDKNILNVALFGVDSREVGDFNGKSDSIMILSINKNTNKLKLISVLRDSLVPYNHAGKTKYTKITEVYSIGGPALAVKTINEIFGLDISEYATVNFYGMSDIIDAVGGIDAEITKDEISSSNTRNINAMIDEQCGYLKINPAPYFVNKTGKVHLNGLQAVAYARIRHGRNIWGSNDDFGRTERQRYVMNQLLQKALNADFSSYPSLVNKLTPHVKTSFSNSEILSLAGVLKNRPVMETSRVPHDKYIINADYRATGASTVYYNYKYAGKVLKALIYEDIAPEAYFETDPIDKTDWYGAMFPSANRPRPDNVKPDTKPQETKPGENKPGKDDGSSSEKPDKPDKPDKPENPDKKPDDGKDDGGKNPEDTEKPDVNPVDPKPDTKPDQGSGDGGKIPAENNKE